MLPASQFIQRHRDGARNPGLFFPRTNRTQIDDHWRFAGGQLFHQLPYGHAWHERVGLIAMNRFIDHVSNDRRDQGQTDRRTNLNTHRQGLFELVTKHDPKTEPRPDPEQGAKAVEQQILGH